MSVNLHPIMAQALKPFSAPKPEAQLLRTLLHKERERLNKLLRVPFELDDGERQGVADEDDVYQAVDECIERHIDEIEARVIELADAAGVTRATMTGLIDTLERDGFVKREPDPNDRRMMSVRLTSRGEHFMQDFLPGHFKAIASIMSTLTDSERKTLVQLLSKVQERAAALHPRHETAPIG